MKTSRPLSVTVAAVLLAALSLPSLIFPLLPTEGVPAFIVYINVVWGVSGLIAAAGLWMLKRWSMWLAIILCALGIIAAWPGVGGAPNALMGILATTGVVGSALTILLVVLPYSRRAYA